MKKNFTTPLLKMDLFNKELILQTSTVTPQRTNTEAAVSALNEAGVEITKIATITL